MNKIIAVAVRLEDGSMFVKERPFRHHNVFHMMYDDFDVSSDMLENSEQGFLDNRGMFLNRKEAYILAKTNGQLLQRKAGQYDGNELFSEDLW